MRDFHRVFMVQVGILIPHSDWPGHHARSRDFASNMKWQCMCAHDGAVTMNTNNHGCTEPDVCVLMMVPVTMPTSNHGCTEPDVCVLMMVQ